MRNVFLASLVVASLALVGCQTVDVTKTAKGSFEPTKAADVEILRTRPDRRYIELATVTTTGHSPSSEAKMHNALREKTSQLGANAVILTESGLDHNNMLWSRGVAIRWQ
jgi:hypothetical protein